MGHTPYGYTITDGIAVIDETAVDLYLKLTQDSREDLTHLKSGKQEVELRFDYLYLENLILRIDPPLWIR